MDNERKCIKREKFCNHRIPLIVAISLVLGVIIGYALSSCHLIFPLVIAIILCVVIFVFLMFFFDAKFCVVIFFIILFFFVGFISVSLKVYGNISRSFDGYKEISGEARVKSVSVDGDEYTVIAENFRSGDLNGGIRLKTYTDLSVGDIIKIDGKAKYVSCEYFNIHPLKNSYDFEAYFASVTIVKKTADFFSSISSKAETALMSNMNETEGGICVALLLGDTRYVSQELYEKFSLSGVAHIFAVSGLHVGFLATAFSFFFAKIGVKGLLKTFLLSLISFLYAGFCGFSVSSLRAVIMCTILGFSTSIGLKYDFLNSISLALVVVVTIFPESLFSYGTLLSFGAVYSIAFLSGPFSKIYSFLPQKIGTACSVSTSAFLGTFPIIAYMCGRVSLFTVVFNVITIPFVGVLFIFLFVGGWLTTIFSALAFLLKPAEILSGFTAYVYSKISVSCQVVNIIPAIFSTILLYIVLFIISDRFNFPKSLKVGATISLPFCLLAFM